MQDTVELHSRKRSRLKIKAGRAVRRRQAAALMSRMLPYHLSKSPNAAVTLSTFKRLALGSAKVITLALLPSDIS